MSGPKARGGGGPRISHDPAPAGSLVAVLERRGRFLTAEPLFPQQTRADGPARRNESARIVLKSARPERGSKREARLGDLVLIRVGARGAPARVLRVLGRPEVARDVIEALMLDRGLRRGFDPALEQEARAAGERVGAAPGARRDLRRLATFTIDPASARDFDDAISAESLGEGRVRVWVHIADVAAHVSEGSLVDREARRRATSVYVPGAVEPMLPHTLSSEACSLVPGVDRAAVTVELELDGATVTRSAFSAKTQMLGDDLLACVLGGVYTDVEKTMIELQRSTVVQETRSAFQNTMQHKFINQVERLSGRNVLAFISNHHVGPDIEIELFMLSPPAPAPAL